MNYIKSILLVFIFVYILIIPGFAGLLEDVDDLTPEEAMLFQQKLEEKKFEATPNNTRINLFIQSIDPSKLNIAFTGVPVIRNLYGASVDLRVPLNQRILAGGSFSGAGNYLIGESSPKVYEDIFLACGNAQFVVEFRLLQTKNFVVSASPGAGIMLGGYNYTKTDDNLKTYYNTNRWGTGFCTSISLDACWNIARGWGLGIGLSYFSGKLDSMRKVLSSVDSSAPEIDLTGTTIRISGSKYF